MKARSMMILHLAPLLLLSLTSVRGICYFPAVYQGEFVSQAALGSDISYSTITVLYDSIPVWGYCHRRIGNNVILMEDSGGLTCFRCFHLALRSSNVVQVHTRGLDKCFTSEEAAVATCPSPLDMQEQQATEVMLYRTKGFLGEPAVSPTYCPFNGAYTFTYSINDGTETELECSKPTSRISDCPYGFGLKLEFEGCSFGAMELSFNCLGDWDGGRQGERFLALMDTGATLKSTQDREKPRPRYRCAIYRQDEQTGKIHLALSSDSTCVSQLQSADRGWETLVLHPQATPDYPASVEALACVFPDWMQGEWEHLDFQGDSLVYKDHRNFKTYTGKCVPQAGSWQEERFLVYTRSQCGDEEYKCLWVKERGVNTLEVQVGLYTSDTPDRVLCGDENFQERTWTTQGRLVIEEKAPYMFTGEYTGVIPDTEGLCAKLYSDCNNPEIMFYTIFNCFNRTEVFEEREYQCLGQWEEDGVIYTYTERRDMLGHECFVGVTTQQGEIYLQEAGNNCERGQEPLRYGMRMSRVAECYHSRQHNPKLDWKLPASTPRSSSPQEQPYSASSSLPVLNLVLLASALVLGLR